MRSDARQSPWRRWVLVAAYAAAIYVQSALPSVVDTSGRTGLDKMAHMAMYALMAVLLCRALTASPMARRSPLQIAVVAVLFSTLYGIGDELHQSLVPARCADIADVVSDFVGSAAGAAFWAVRQRRRSRI
ncbi:MAG: VanZ family protein [Desulfobacteraceae bacterium]|jgi:VanZ family protein|nr:VanZ family protein [Desulfobacteraceae bacterium]